MTSRLRPAGPGAGRNLTLALGAAAAFLGLLPALAPRAGQAVAATAASPANPAPTRTPTPPRRRLTGGFGRTPLPGREEDGQALSDVVKAAGESRKPKDGKPVAITNDSLVKDPKQGRLPTSSPPSNRGTPGPAGRPVSATSLAATPSASATAPPAQPTATPATSASSATADEAVWRERSRSARRRVEELKAAINQLEIDTKQLETDFYRWDDGQYRDRVIKPAWDKKREELETAKQELTAAETDLAELPEQARKAGALPGWIRE